MTEEKSSKTESAEQTDQGANEGQGNVYGGGDFVGRDFISVSSSGNVFKGSLIPTGTGYVFNNINESQTDWITKNFREFETLINNDVGFVFANAGHLTPTYLESIIMPFITAIEDLQHIINEVKGEYKTEVLVRHIQQHSPVSVSMDGAAEAMQLFQETVVPWRRKHAEIMAQLAEREKLVDIEAKKAEVLASRATTEKMKIEAEKQRQEVEKMKLENEKLRLSLAREKIQLALEMLAVISPELNEVDKIQYAMKLLGLLDVLTQSPLEITLMVMKPSAE